MNKSLTIKIKNTYTYIQNMNKTIINSFYIVVIVQHIIWTLLNHFCISLIYLSQIFPFLFSGFRFNGIMTF